MTLVAKYKGTCVDCGGAIRPGTRIYWDAESRAVSHETCPSADVGPFVRPAPGVPVRVLRLLAQADGAR